MTRSRRLTRSLLLAATLILGAAAPARADDPRAGARRDEECGAAAVAGQTLQRQGQLLAARERFGACARDVCRPDIVEDCTRWLRDTVDATPTIVIAPRDRAGADVAGVSVTIDGRPVDEGDASRAIPLDPGAHVVRCERAGAPPESRSVVLREGEKRRLVEIVLEVPGAVPPAPGPPRGEARGGPRIPLPAYVAGSIALVGLGVFGSFAVIGADDRARSGCDVGCAAEDASRVRRELAIADVGLGIGAVALAVAAITVLLR